jgi:Pilus assembly protein, PilP
MRLAKSIAMSIAAAALALWLAPSAAAQANAAHKPPAAGSSAKPAKKRAARPAGMARPAEGAMAEQKPMQGAAAQKPAGKKHAPAEKARGEAAAPQGGETPVAAHRDPFLSLLAMKKSGPPLPPGKAGLVIAQIRVDGTVKSQNGMIAVVSNPQQRVYFVREGDRLYDGQVEKISLDGVVFREMTKDAFGKPVEREVTKRLYSSAGEQQ